MNLPTLLQFGMSSCKARIFSLILSLRLCSQKFKLCTGLKSYNSETTQSRSFQDICTACLTLSDRLCTSAALLLLEPEARAEAIFFTPTDSSSASCTS